MDLRMSFYWSETCIKNHDKCVVEKEEKRNDCFTYSTAWHATFSPGLSQHISLFHQPDKKSMGSHKAQQAYVPVAAIGAGFIIEYYQS